MSETRPKRPRKKRENNHDFLVVGIGASAGGIKALERLLDRLPADSGMAFVVILHLSPEHESNLAELLQRRTTMPVIKVVEPVKVEPDHVYVIPPAKHLVMTDGHVSLREPEMKKGRRIPVDLFFRTLATAYHVKSVGIVLSGTGTDGTLGLRHIKEAGGVSIAQELQEAEHDGMPRSAINSGMVDFILPVADMPEKLVSLRHISEKIQTPPETDKPLSESEADALREVLTILRARTGNDFTNYKKSTVLRRITRRLQVNGIETIKEYVKLLRERPSESRDLLSDMIISVTNFFRDPDAFRTLAREVIPKIFSHRGSGDQVRVWVTGCATGEEAYSLAILMLEHAQSLTEPPFIQIFATDIDQEAIDEAREGIFAESISVDVSPERLKRFFTREDSFYRIKKEVRETLLFAPHNILRDPPFSKLDLISCRNLLIYLNRETQERALELFHFALKPEGYLFLGASESADSLPDLFMPVDKKYRIFKRRYLPNSVNYLPTMPAAGRWEAKLPETAKSIRKSFSFLDLHYQMLEHYSSPSALVNNNYEIMHLSENAGNFLRFGGGEPSRNIIKVVHPDLRLDLRAALLSATQDSQPTETRRVRINLDGEPRFVTIRVRPIERPESVKGYLLVIFNENEVAEAAPNTAALTGLAKGDMEPLVRQLEDELSRTKEQLRLTIEQYETSTEELKASNEELQAINEELRSATEELETSKEELQSLNEELRTVNHELKDKVDELGRANSDLQNLLAATDIGTIFLDRGLAIKRYTPSVQQIFNIIASDTNRPLAHLTHKLEYDRLAEDANNVLMTLTKVEREVRTVEGQWYIARLLPYRTAEDKIDGVVITFVDITQRKLAEEQREELHDKLMRERALMNAVVLQMPAGVMIAEVGSNDVILANEPAEKIWREAKSSQEGEKYSDYSGFHLGDRPYTAEEWPIWRSLHRNETVRNQEMRVRRGQGSWAYFDVNSSPVHDQNGNVIAAILTFHDVTEQKRVNASLRAAQARVHALVESIDDYAIFSLNNNGVIVSWNKGAESIFGYSESEAVGLSGAIIFTEEDRVAGEFDKEMEKALKDGRAEDERWHVRKNGSRFYASGVMSVLRDSNDGFVKILRDLTGRKQMEEVLRRSHDVLEERVRERTREIESSYEALETEISERRSADEQIKELLRRIVNTQELERRRIARDLHDQLGQQLTALRLSLESLKQQTRDRASLLSHVEMLQAVAEQIDKDVDFLAWELRPATLDELGLGPTIENFVHEWSKHFSIPAEFHTAGLASIRLAPETETNLYRIMQEALNNVYKHAQAGRVDVILEKRDGSIVLIVEDNGQGFDAEAKSRANEGLGLVSMRERASLSGGTLEIQSAPGEGTTIFVRVGTH